MVLLKVNRLEQILSKLNLYLPSRITPRSKTLIDVIITNNRDTVIHAETSLSIAVHHAVSCMINLRKQRMTPFQILWQKLCQLFPVFFLNYTYATL